MVIGWRRRILSETLLGFGLSDAAVGLQFAVSDAAGSVDMAPRIYFIVQAIVAAAIPLAGLALVVAAPAHSRIGR